jgi:large subunit ribosomal protein L9
VVAEKVAKELKELQGLKARIEGLALEVKARVGEEGKLFGSVTAPQIEELLAARGVAIDRRQIDLPEPIKQAGDHSVAVRLHRDVVASLRVRVTPEE